MPSPIRYLLSFDRSQWFEVLLQSCPHCKKQGYLVSHGNLCGYSICGQFQEKRGKRILCSNRGRKSGCGKTFSILLFSKLRGRLVSTRLLWIFLSVYLLAGLSLRTAWTQAMLSQGAKFCPSTGYKLRDRFGRAQSLLRVKLCQTHPPPSHLAADQSAFGETIGHLRSLFPQSEDPIEAFQSYFQSGFLEAF